MLTEQMPQRKEHMKTAPRMSPYSTPIEIDCLALSGDADDFGFSSARDWTLLNTRKQSGLKNTVVKTTMMKGNIPMSNNRKSHRVKQNDRAICECPGSRPTQKENDERVIRRPPQLMTYAVMGSANNVPKMGMSCRADSQIDKGCA